MSDPIHFKAELQDLLDKRLAASKRAEVEQHLAACVECQRTLDALRWTKELSGRFANGVKAPAELRAKILSNIRAASRPAPEILEPASHPVSEPSGWRWIFKPGLRPYFATGLLVLALAAWLLRPGSATLPDLVANDFRAFQTQQLALEFSTGDVKKMEGYFAERGLKFNTRVFDLGMMNYQLAGGRIEPSRRQPRAQFVYRGPANQSLLCQMFVGQTTALPPGATVREDHGIRFHIYEAKGVTSVFWQEGAVVCALASDIPQAEVVQLAFAKAMN